MLPDMTLPIFHPIRKRTRCRKLDVPSNFQRSIVSTSTRVEKSVSLRCQDVVKKNEDLFENQKVGGSHHTPPITITQVHNLLCQNPHIDHLPTPIIMRIAAFLFLVASAEAFIMAPHVRSVSRVHSDHMSHCRWEKNNSRD
jgi:hypothetical protein